MNQNISPIVAPMSLGRSAMLMLYTPRGYQNVVLRPYVYGFERATVDKLMGAGDTLKEAFARPEIANSPQIANSIKPDSNGTMIDMDQYSMYWTFVLTITQPNNYNGVAMTANGYRTTIFTGHCLDEPIAPNTLFLTTPIINRDCRLLVHTHQILNAGQQVVNAFGMMSPTKVTTNEDVIDPSLNAAAPGSDLFRITPTDVLSNYSYSGTEESVISTPQLCAVANTDRTPIQSSLKTPGVHLRHILEGLDTEIEFAKASQLSPMGVGISGVISDCEDTDRFKAGVRNNLSQYAYSGRIETDGIQASSIITIGEVEAIYPDLKAIPQKIADFTVLPDNSGYMDILPQTIMNPKVAYSSMISSAVSSIAADCGLSSISFGYVSYDPNCIDSSDKSRFSPVPESVHLTCPPADPAQLVMSVKGAVKMFEFMFKKNVVPFVVGVVGNFELMASYTLNAETHVNLQLLDYGGNTNLGENLWFETPNRLGSLSSTSIGSETVFNNNGHAINEFVIQTQARAATFGMGIPPVAQPSGQVTNISGFSGF